AVAFAFSGFLTSYPDQQLPVLESTVWLPLALYCVERGARAIRGARAVRGDSATVTGRPVVAPAWLACAGGCVGLAFLGGHPQTVLYITYLCGAYLLFRVPWRRWWLAVWPLLAAGGLCAVQLLPSAQLFAFNHKGRLSYGFAAGGITWRDLEAIVTNNPPGGRILYVGLIPLALAVLGVIVARQRQAIFWGAVAVISGLLALGTHGPLFRLFFAVLPGWDLFRDQERAVLATTLALAVLAGLGCAWVVGRISQTGPKWHSSSPLQGVAERGPAGREVMALAIAGLLVLGSFGNLALLNRGNNLWRGNPLSAFNLGPLLAPIRADKDIFRVRVSENSISHNSGNVLDLQIVSGNSPFELTPFKSWIGDLDRAQAVNEWQIMQLTNTHWIVSSRTLCGTACKPADGMRQMGQFGPLRLFKILYPLPRAFFVTRALGVATEGQAIDAINSSAFAGDKLIVLHGTPAHSAVNPPTGTLRASLVGYAPRLVDIRTSSTVPAYLFTSEIAYPAWRATIDGQPVPILTADGIFRALDVPPGQHHVVFQYVPELFYIGGAISAATLLAFACLGIWCAWPAVRHPLRAFDTRA
ncbi:MAG: YfhO family protein, partial [Chloroflexota bacterium]